LQIYVYIYRVNRHYKYLCALISLSDVDKDNQEQNYTPQNHTLLEKCSI